MLLSALNIHNEPAKPGVLDRRDPRGKIILTLFLLIVIFSLHIEQLLQVSAVLIFLFILLLLSRRPPAAYLKPLMRIIPMMLIISIILPFRSFAAGEPALIHWSGPAVYESGLFRFLELNVKFICLALSMMILLMTTSFQSLLHSLESFRLPVWLSAILYYMVYFIFLLKEEIQKQYLAYRSRYIYLTPWRRLRIIARMTAIYFIRLIERNERTTMAMISRGFYGRIYSRNSLVWRSADSLLLILSFAFLTGIKIWL